VQYDGINVSVFCGHDIKEETERVKHGCLNVCDKRCARELVGIPKRDSVVG